MSQILPVSDHNERKRQHPSGQQNNKKDQNGENFEENLQNTMKPQYSPPGPRGQDEYKPGDNEIHNIRYGYRNNTSLQKQILKHKFKPSQRLQKRSGPFF